MFYCFNFSVYLRFLVEALIETNVNISNELNSDDVCRSVNYIVLLATFSPAGFIHFARDPM